MQFGEPDQVRAHKEYAHSQCSMLLYVNRYANSASKIYNMSNCHYNKNTRECNIKVSLEQMHVPPIQPITTYQALAYFILKHELESRFGDAGEVLSAPRK